MTPPPAIEQSLQVAQSSWSDPRTGTTEESAFVGPGHQRIMITVHTPNERSRRAGVVLCNSLYEDLQVNYRRHLLLSRKLAERGIASVRFHYRGTGNSDDLASGAMTLTSLVEDGQVAASWLRERAGVEALAICGSKVGALVATELAMAGDAALVLWAPILSGSDYFRQMARANLVAGLRGEPRRRQAATLTQLLEMEGYAEMLGSRVLRETYQDLSGRTLPTEVGGGRRVLLVQLGAGHKLTSPHARVVASWRAGGADVEVVHARDRQQWFLPEKWEPEDDTPEVQEVTDQIARWIDSTLAVTR